MSKLTNRDIEIIIKQRLNGKPVAEIARYFQVTRPRVYQILRRYKETQEYPVLKQPGRRTQSIDLDSEELILKSYHANNRGPIPLEKKIEETHGIHILHNMIYKVLLCRGFVEINMKKRKQRKWVRYEQEHSMSLWQGDWKEFVRNERKQWLIAFMGDSSRLITCYGVFDSPTTKNTLLVLRKGFTEYGVPREILTDHGTQFVSARDRKHAHHTFKEFLNQYGIKHIVATVKHPQTNGKIERLFREVERWIEKFGSIDKIVHWQNVITPHMSLDYDVPANLFWYRLPPERVLSFAQKWLFV